MNVIQIVLITQRLWQFLCTENALVRCGVSTTHPCKLEVSILDAVHEHPMCEVSAMEMQSIYPAVWSLSGSLLGNWKHDETNIHCLRKHLDICDRSPMVIA